MPKKQGFSLIELSIVLVLISLIVAGIVAGKALIHSARIQSVYRDVGAIRVAINSFYLAYDFLPGDFSDAFDYWGAACGGNSIAPSGCNGNGDGQLTFNAPLPNETFRAWQHLTLSEIMPGSYSGQIASSASSPNVPGIDYPASKFPQGGYAFVDWSGTSDKQAVMLELGKQSVNDPDAALLMTKDARAIDEKMDDGFSRIGKVTAKGGWDRVSRTEISGCINESSDPKGYELSVKAPVCRLYFLLEL